jgi:hypothetical protein
MISYGIEVAALAAYGKVTYNAAWRFGIGTLRFSALCATPCTVDLIFEKNLSRWTIA